MPDSLIHDTTWEASRHVIKVFAPCLREEEQREAFALVYEIIKAAIESYKVMDTRRQQRLKPCSN